MKKERDGSKIKRVYDKPKTPCQRVLERNDVPDEVKQLLQKQSQHMNSFQLKRVIDRKLRTIMDSLQKSA